MLEAYSLAGVVEMCFRAEGDGIFARQAFSEKLGACKLDLTVEEMGEDGEVEIHNCFRSGVGVWGLMEKHVVRLRLHGCVVCGVLRTTPTREAGRGSRVGRAWQKSRSVRRVFSTLSGRVIPKISPKHRQRIRTARLVVEWSVFIVNSKDKVVSYTAKVIPDCGYFVFVLGRHFDGCGEEDRFVESVDSRVVRDFDCSGCSVQCFPHESEFVVEAVVILSVGKVCAVEAGAVGAVDEYCAALGDYCYDSCY